MDELMDLLVQDASASQVSDNIKNILFAKSAEKIETLKPQVANSVFNNPFEIDNEALEATDSD